VSHQSIVDLLCQIGPFSTESTESKCMMDIPVMCYAPVPSIEVEQPTCNTIETATSDQGADSSSMIPEKFFCVLLDFAFLEWNNSPLLKQ
jgi:hypothetical protein